MRQKKNKKTAKPLRDAKGKFTKKAPPIKPTLHVDEETIMTENGQNVVPSAAEAAKLGKILGDGVVVVWDGTEKLVGDANNSIPKEEKAPEREPLRKDIFTELAENTNTGEIKTLRLVIKEREPSHTSDEWFENLDIRAKQIAEEERKSKCWIERIKKAWREFIDLLKNGPRETHVNKECILKEDTPEQELAREQAWLNEKGNEWAKEIIKPEEVKDEQNK